MSIAVFAADARPTAALTIRSMDDGDIRVMIDGRRFEPGYNSMMIREVDPGKHNIKIYREERRGIFGKTFRLVYDHSIRVKPNTHMLISVDRNGKASVMQQKIKRNDRNFRNNNRFDDYFDEREFDFRNGERYGRFDEHYGFERGMDDREFSLVLQQMDKEWFEGNKIKSATQVVKSNRLTTDQVMQIMRLFTFENNKLEVAKQAYANTVDKRNYESVFTLLTFNSSKDELRRFISYN